LARERRRRDLMPSVMLGIAVAVSALVLAIAGVVVWLSFYSALPGVAELTFTLQNYVRVFTRPETYAILWNTVAFAGIAVAVASLFGIPAAWLVERTDLPGKPAVFTAMTIGLLIPNFTVAMGWIFLTQPRIGILNRWAIDLLGLAEPPFDIASIWGMGWVE